MYIDACLCLKRGEGGECEERGGGVGVIGGKDCGKWVMEGLVDVGKKHLHTIGINSSGCLRSSASFPIDSI